MVSFFFTAYISALKNSKELEIARRRADTQLKQDSETNSEGILKQNIQKQILFPKIPIPVDPIGNLLEYAKIMKNRSYKKKCY